MDVEPLPKVTFLPAQLTELVIKGWTGDIIDYEKNGQVSRQSVSKDLYPLNSYIHHYFIHMIR